MEIFPQRTARDELGALAGVSGKTYEHAVEVIKKAPEEVKQACRNGEISINKAYQEVKKAEKRAERQRVLGQVERLIILINLAGSLTD